MSVYSTVVPVRFGHVDPAGIAYYPRIYDYIHEVFEDVWDVHVGERYYSLLMERRIGFPTVHSEVNFHRPLRFGDRPVVSATCFLLGNSSLGMHYVFRIGDLICVDARMTTVCTNLEEMKSVPIEERFRRRFEEIME